MNPGRKVEGAPAIQLIGPWPAARSQAIGNAVWHSDREFCHHGSWFTLLRMSKIPRDPETGEVLPCGDTMWADMSVAWEDLPPEEKEFYENLKGVYDWKVAILHVKRQAEQNVPGAAERLAELNRIYPSIERPLARKHPVTGKTALIGADPAYLSHIVGLSKEQRDEIVQRGSQLCEVPEYQLRLGWHSEGDVVIYDNYVVKHRVVADFYNIPPESRLLENIGTKGHPMAQNVLRPDAEIDDSHTKHNDDQKQGRSTALLRSTGALSGQPGASRL